jgi:hypothetical protein
VKHQRQKKRLVVVGVAVLCLIFIPATLAAHALPNSSAGPEVVPTRVCTCSTPTATIGSDGPTFRGHSSPTSDNFDEQIGLTFTQNFTSLEYNVTAIKQTDPLLGTGPAYLLNGLSTAGYWYQVGVSWDWSPGQNPGTGFDMNYEVFDSSGNTVFPTDGQGGVLAFSGPVNSGDTILLDLYFSSSTHNVVMLAEDTETGATTSETYPSMGATFFIGLPDAVANSNGFFTGLMTEWYHGAPYYADEAEVVYSNPTFALSSAWMWMDEFDASTLQSIFAANTSAPISYSTPNALQEFSFNGTTEYSDAYNFVTGSLANATKQSSTVPLTLSFSVQNGGNASSPPTLTYVSDGTTYIANLTESPIAYNADIGTKWSVSSELGGSNATDRWQTDQTAVGVANSSETIEFIFYHQTFVTFSYTVEGKDEGFSAPAVTFVSFGSAATTPSGTGVWADVGSRYQYSNPISGPTQDERWVTASAGTIGSAHDIEATYYLQYLVNFDISFKDTEVFPALSITFTSAGETHSATLVVGTDDEWIDAGASYSIPGSFSLETGQRLITDGSDSGVASVNLTVVLIYEHEFYIGITPNVQGGGTVSPPPGWYVSGSNIQLEATASAGWAFEGWQGTGSDSVSGSSPSMALTVGPGAATNETAIFYPGISIDAAGPSAVSYSDGSISGTLSAGKISEVYVPYSSMLNLTTTGIPILTASEGWTGAANSSGTSVSILVDGPAAITSNSTFSYTGVALLTGVVVAIVVGVALGLRSRSHRAVHHTADASAPSAAEGNI